MNNENGLILKNEYESNLFVAKAMRVTSVILTLILILNVAGIFKIKTGPMTVAYILGMVLLLLPTLLVNVMKMTSPYLKWLFVTIAIVFVCLLIITLNWHAVVVFIYAIGISGLYFSKKLNLYAVIMSVITFSIAQILAYTLGYTQDRNELDFYRVIVFVVIPRAFSLIAVSSIFLSLNARMTNLMSNLLDADAQNTMLENMKAMKEKSLEVSDKLVETVESLSEVSANTTDSNNEIFDKAGKASEDAERTQHHLGDVEDNITKISENLGTLADSTDEISDISGEVHKLTMDNSDNMKRALEGFDRITESTERSMNVVGELADKSQEIMKIVEVITSISSQTNLLALNASIESARAGEAGRGFAVVADEIRILADQTKKAVGDISNIIDEVVDGTNNAKTAMLTNTELVTEGRKIIGEAEESTDHVTLATEKMNEKISEIDAVTRNVAQYAEKIVGIVHEVTSISAESRDSLLRVSETSEISVAEMEKLVVLVEDIKVMSNQLNEMVNI